jgi:uncharacterized integral membrane protein (TIGR00697 family)
VVVVVVVIGGSVVVVMMPALLVSYVLGVVFFEGQFQGAGQLAQFNLFVARIACASFMAYLLGQILDVSVFNRLRQLKAWWVAPVASTIVGNLLDTMAFFFIAFWRSPDAFMAAHWVEIATVDYGVKLLISIGLFVPAYGILLRYLYSDNEQNNPNLISWTNEKIGRMVNETDMVWFQPQKWNTNVNR